jgi:hypothetical protein
MSQGRHLSWAETRVAVLDYGVWQQPILRFADTFIRVAVGVAAAWIGLRLIRPRIRQAR